MTMRAKKGLLAAAAGALLLFFWLLWPLDFFVHLDTPPLPRLDWAQGQAFGEGTAATAQQPLEVRFRPGQRHFSGFYLYLGRQQAEGGSLVLTVLDAAGRERSAQRLELAGLSLPSWQKIPVRGSYKAGEEYTLRISAGEGSPPIDLLTVADALIPEETLSGSIPLRYAYDAPVFSTADKLLLSLCLAGLFGLFAAGLLGEFRGRGLLRGASVFLLLTVLAAQNGLRGSMDQANMPYFVSFQDYSEALVTGAIAVSREPDCPEQGRWGLYTYNTVEPQRTDEEWDQGYARGEPAIQLHFSDYTWKVAVAGNRVRFANGAELVIEKAEENTREELILTLQADGPLSAAEYGPLRQAVFITPSGESYPAVSYSPYISQYGLQGRVFVFLSRFIGVENMHLLCCLALALTFSSITFLIARRYGPLLAGVFYMTLLLAPKVTNFARNLYWVEFTWFIPMAVGLFFLWKSDDPRGRLLSYAAAFAALFVRSLCGYEYVSTIMLGMILFPLAELVLALHGRRKKEASRLFWGIFILGAMALLGFAAAILAHAWYRGGGDLWAGVVTIYQKDALRRTVGAYPLGPGGEMLPSAEASVWQVLCMYFHVPQQLVTGIDGNLFPLICIVPLMIFCFDYRAKRLDLLSLCLYLFSFIAAVSWFVLAKDHSYVHETLNIVLWYFGYVQVCLYVLLKKFLQLFAKEPLLRQLGIQS